MARRVIKHHSAKALRSRLGTVVLKNLRVPQLTKSGNVIRYKKTTQFKVGDRIIVHKAGEPRLRRIKSIRDLLYWFTNVDGYGHDAISPNNKLCDILYPTQMKKIDDEIADRNSSDQSDATSFDHQSTPTSR